MVCSLSNYPIIFMGTAKFAVPSLQLLLKNNQHIVAVVTTPDNLQGRGKKYLPSPIKLEAQKYNLTILQPENLEDKNFLRELASYRAFLQVVVCFRILPKVVWELPKLGTINLHASLLPAYRGAAPINWAIIHGEKKTGVTTFFINENIDTGHILFQEEEPIYEDDTAGSLHDRLMHKGAKLLVRTVEALKKNQYTIKKQEKLLQSNLSKAPKIHKATCKINWNQTAAQICSFIRGLAPKPTAWSIINDGYVKIYEVNVITQAEPALAPGETSSDRKNYLYVGTKDHKISIIKLQLAGRKIMLIKTLLRGHTF